MAENSCMSRKSKATGTIEESGRRILEEGNGRADGAMADGKIDDEAIAARAYQIYEREGRADGRDLEHWLQAEAELRAERQNQGQSRAQPGSQASQPTSPRSARLQQESQEGAGRPSAAQSGLQSGMAGSR